MYIHCFNHHLHLALRTGMADILELEDFFLMLSDLHEFFIIPNVAALSGENIKSIDNHKMVWSFFSN